MTDATVRIEATPNPEAVRVVSSVRLGNATPREFREGDDVDLAVAAALLAINGVAAVMVGFDFVTVARRSPAHPWSELAPLLLQELRHIVASGVLAPDAEVSNIEPSDDTSTELDGLVARHIADVLRQHVRPLVARDGGDVTLVRFDEQEGVAYVRMGGACGGCPSGMMTLKRVVEQAVIRYVPEVRRVTSLDLPSASADPAARFRAWVAARFGSAQQRRAPPRTAMLQRA